MRITAGILMIIVGFLSISILGTMTDIISRVAMVVPVDLDEGTQWMVRLTFLSLGLTWGGAICIFRKRTYWLALSGAICSIFIGFLTFIFGILGYIFFIMAILAVIFLIKRKGEFLT
jgi:hypothetical protein